MFDVMSIRLWLSGIGGACGYSGAVGGGVVSGLVAVPMLRVPL